MKHGKKYMETAKAVEMCIRDRINGKEYQTRQHGFAREKEFTCVEESTEKLRYRLMSDEETRKYYPFDFVLWITYELREKEVLVSWEVENRSGERCV